jgi:hypothetical protein
LNSVQARDNAIAGRRGGLKDGRRCPEGGHYGQSGGAFKGLRKKASAIPPSAASLNPASAPFPAIIILSLNLSLFWAGKNQKPRFSLEINELPLHLPDYISRFPLAAKANFTVRDRICFLTPWANDNSTSPIFLQKPRSNPDMFDPATPCSGFPDLFH